jgi:hypothetical protein
MIDLDKIPTTFITRFSSAVTMMPPLTAKEEDKPWLC